jgi:nucleotide-binding universal stress UspA family protein
MFENVLVGVDGRSNGRDAIALAAQLVQPGGALTLAHVYSGHYKPAYAITPANVESEREAARRLLEQERTDTGANADVVVVEAQTPGKGLHEQADEQGADLLVLGTCRHGAFGRIFLSDDTRAALNGAPCAVAIAPHGYAQYPSPFATIGVGYDGSPESEAALDVARALAQRTRARLRALQAVSCPNYMFAGLVASAGEGIDQMVKEADAQLKALPGVEGQAEYGLAGEELAAFSKDVDLLVVGSRGYGPVRRLMLGSTSNYLQRHARGPLLILRREATTQSDGGAGSPDASRAAIRA